MGEATDRLRFGEHVIDVSARRLFAGHSQLRLEPKVMDLLLYLVRHRGRCVAKAELQRALWPDTRVGDSSLPRLVKELRRQLKDDSSSPQFIRTIYARGYQFLLEGDALAPAERSPARAPRALPGNESALERCLAAGLSVGPALARALAPALRLADNTLPILIEGETGTGKDHVAHTLHLLGGRGGAFVALRCAGLALGELSELLCTSQATRDGPAGLFALAGGGTLYIDELSELGQPEQLQLLRALSLHEAESSAAPVRLLSSSRLPARELARSGALRPALYARLAGYTLQLPPLRERASDLEGLARHFLTQHGARALPRHALAFQHLASYAWPFNVRELEHLVEAQVRLYGGEALQPEHLPPYMAGALVPEPTTTPAAQLRAR